MISNVLLIGMDVPSEAFELGVDSVECIRDAQSLAQHSSYRVVAIHLRLKDGTESLKWMQARLESYPSTRFLLRADESCADILLEAVATGQVFHIIHSAEENWVGALQQAMEQVSFDQQNDDLLQLINEQSRRLEGLKSELEDRVAKRTKSLEASRTKLVDSQKRLETLHAVLLALQEAQSISHIESRLFAILSAPFELESLKIQFESQLSLHSPSTFAPHVLQLTLPTAGSKSTILFMTKPAQRPFNNKEKLFLEKIAESIGLAIDRLLTAEQFELLKRQWDATFDAILDPFCLTDSKFQILRTNQTFARHTQKSTGELLGQHALFAFFGADWKVPPDCQQPKFKITTVADTPSGQKTFDLSSATLAVRSDFESQKIKWVLFRDVTNSKMLEKQLLESAKMVELGLIGSSIAHELNNPIGGMLTFLHLMKSDLSEHDLISSDIEQMEIAAKRCKDIIENLLGFARKTSATDLSTFDLKPVLLQTIRLAELQTRSAGIETTFKCELESIPVHGDAQHVQQALHHILQNAREAVLEKLKTDHSVKGTIQIEAKDDKGAYVITVTDNGPGIDKQNIRYIFNPLFTTKNPHTNSGLGLTKAFKIIREHGGDLEILSQTGHGTAAKISLQRLDFVGDGRHFDRKI